MVGPHELYSFPFTWPSFLNKDDDDDDDTRTICGTGSPRVTGLASLNEGK